MSARDVLPSVSAKLGAFFAVCVPEVVTLPVGLWQAHTKSLIVEHVEKVGPG